MRRVEKTIKEGGYLTEELYVPKYVWYQKEAMVKEIDQKIFHFEKLQKKLKGIKIVYVNGATSTEARDLDKAIGYVKDTRQQMLEEMSSSDHQKVETASQAT